MLCSKRRNAILLSEARDHTFFDVGLNGMETSQEAEKDTVAQAQDEALRIGKSGLIGMRIDGLNTKSAKDRMPLADDYPFTQPSPITLPLSLLVPLFIYRQLLETLDKGFNSFGDKKG